jgi:hypothetical protein
MKAAHTELFASVSHPHAVYTVRSPLRQGSAEETDSPRPQPTRATSSARSNAAPGEAVNLMMVVPSSTARGML